MGTAKAHERQTMTESEGISPDWTFVKTPHGFFRVVQLVIVISGYITLRSSPAVTCEKAAVHFAMYGCVSVFAISIVVVTVAAFFFRLDRLCPLINLPLTVLLRDVLLTSLHLIVTILMFISSSTCSLWIGSHVAVIVFSAGSLWLFAVTSYMNFQWFRQELSCVNKGNVSPRVEGNEKCANPEGGRTNPSFEQETADTERESRRTEPPTPPPPPPPVSNMPDIVAQST